MALLVYCILLKKIIRNYVFQSQLEYIQQQEISASSPKRDRVPSGETFRAAEIISTWQNVSLWCNIHLKKKSKWEVFLNCWDSIYTV